MPDDPGAWVQQASLATPVLPVVNVLPFVSADLGARVRVRANLKLYLVMLLYTRPGYANLTCGLFSLFVPADLDAVMITTQEFVCIAIPSVLPM